MIIRMRKAAVYYPATLKLFRTGPMANCEVSRISGKITCYRRRLVLRPGGYMEGDSELGSSWQLPIQELHPYRLGHG